MKQPIAMLEMEEYLFASTAAGYAQDHPQEEVVKHLRESLRLHRFFVFTWLIHNGVELPMEMVADYTHPPVGHQQPDRKMDLQ